MIEGDSYEDYTSLVPLDLLKELQAQILTW